MDRICKLAIETFGTENQINMAIEEMAELIVALNHWRRGRASKDDVIEEIADCYIMTCQLCHIVTDDEHPYAVKEKVYEKLEKLERRIEECHQ